MGWATQRGPRPSTSHRLYSCVIVSGFRAALDLDTYPLNLSNIIPRCAERIKPGRGKPVQNPRRKCSAVVETNCVVAEYRIPYRSGPGPRATQRGPRPRLVATSHRLASGVIVSGFRAALDLDIYPLRNLIRPRCAGRAKPGRGKPVLIMHIGVFACFHAITLERNRFSKIATLVFVVLKLLVSLISRLVACSARIRRQTDRHTVQTHRTTTITLATHARRGLIMHSAYWLPL